jgi:hypothetical protein
MKSGINGKVWESVEWSLSGANGVRTDHADIGKSWDRLSETVSKPIIS